MSGLGGFNWVMIVTAAVAAPVLVIAACAIQLRGDDDGPSPGSLASRTTNPLAAELDRCRKVTSGQVAELRECRLVWAENRRRFLGSRKAPAAPSATLGPMSPTTSSAQPKDPERLLQGWPPVATSGRE
jgi:conjugative transfer region protein TrbK